MSYICSIAVIYAFPTIILFSKLIKKIFVFVINDTRPSNYIDDKINVKTNNKIRSNSYGFVLLATVFLTLTPQFWIPVMLGYVDVVGVGVIFAILILHFRVNLLEKSFKELILLGLLISLLIILRRWYAYWVVGYFVAATSQEIFGFLRNRGSFENLATALKKIGLIGITSVASFFALASNIGIKMLKTDYADIYSAYRHSSTVLQHFEKLYSHFGLITIIICASGIVVMFARKNLRQRATFLSVLFIVTFYLFTNTQNIDLHHYYWVISILVIFAAAAIREIYCRLEKRFAKIVFVLIFAAICSANFATVFFQTTDGSLKSFSFAFSQTRIYPKTRSDYEQIHSLLLSLNDLTRDSNSKIYVLSSSISLNSSLLKNACFAFEPDLQPLASKILNTNDVDKRDGFPFQMFEADYVIVTSPPGFHLLPENQKVIGILAEQIVNQHTIGTAYNRLPLDFTLEDSSRVSIYQKKRAFNPEELQGISEIFINFYPEHREKFEFKREMIEKFSLY